MENRHPLITKWAAEKAHARELFRREEGPIEWGFNNLDYRQHRILSRIFFAVEKCGVLPTSFGCPEFHFEYQETITRASLRPIDPYTHSDHAELRFVIVDPCAHGSTAYAEWSDGDLPLEYRIPEIADAILAATRAVAFDHRERTKSLLEAELVRLLDRIRQSKEPGADAFAARVDPRTFRTLLAMSEQHRAAALVRRFLRSLSKRIGDGSMVVADHSLDDWMTWAAVKTDEFDPLVQGPEYVFEKLVRS